MFLYNNTLQRLLLVTTFIVANFLIHAKVVANALYNQQRHNVVSDVYIISDDIELEDADPLITPLVMGETFNAALPTIEQCVFF